MAPAHNRIEDEKLIAELHRVADIVDGAPTYDEYDEHARYGSTTLARRYDGSWNKVLSENGYAPNQGQNIPTEDLVSELHRVAEIVDGPPTREDYREYADYSVVPLLHRHGDSWNTVLTEYGYETNHRVSIPKDELVSELHRVAELLGKPPAKREYTEHADYSYKPLEKRYDGSWNAVLRGNGYGINSLNTATEKELIDRLHRSADGEIAPSTKNLGKDSVKVFSRHFGSYWSACVRAGLKPRKRRPLSPEGYQKFVQTAIEEPPADRIVPLLASLTGMPPEILTEFREGWVVDRRNKSIVRVPQTLTESDGQWLFRLPEMWVDPVTGDERKTLISGTLDWYWNYYHTVDLAPDTICRDIMRVSKKAELHPYREVVDKEAYDMEDVPRVRPGDLRVTHGINLARRSVGEDAIRRRLGVDHTHYPGTVQEIFLWLDEREDFQHPDYDSD
jgi:hypothetical protein